MPDPTPINTTRSRKVKLRTRITMAVLWLVLFIPMLVVCNHLAENGGGPLLALMGATIAWLILLPVVLLLGRRWFRDHNQYDIPIVPPKPRETPAPYADRPKPHLVEGSYLRPSDWPIVSVLDPGWLNRYRFLDDEDLHQARGDMCSEALRNWSGEHPDAPANGFRPMWFESMDEQAQALLVELQRCEIIGGTPSTTLDAEEYFRRNARWPDGWYQARGLPIPPPGPDPDWRLNDPVRALANAVVIGGAAVGALYVGVWKPLHRR
ncbi:MAG: hypothetical protein KGQ66_04600 [Acidobacteriota bacterium]|nr:hypothetical protein [Acidobacteriota bacterium]